MINAKAIPGQSEILGPDISFPMPGRTEPIGLFHTVSLQAILSVSVTFYVAISGPTHMLHVYSIVGPSHISWHLTQSRPDQAHPTRSGKFQAGSSTPSTKSDYMGSCRGRGCRESDEQKRGPAHRCWWVRRGRTRWPGLQMLVASNRTNSYRDNTCLCYAVKVLDLLLYRCSSSKMRSSASRRSPRILTRLTRCSARCWVHSG